MEERKLKRLRAELHVKLINAGMLKHKAAMLSAYGVDSSKELTANQLQEIIKKIAPEAALKNKFSYENDKQRKKIISLFKTVGITDITKIKSIVKEKWTKDFNNYTKEEYQKIIAVIENKWIPFYLSKIANNGQKQS